MSKWKLRRNRTLLFYYSTRQLFLETFYDKCQKILIKEIRKIGIIILYSWM